MNLTFEKTALITRSVEAFHDYNKQRFDRLTKAATRGTKDIIYNRMSPEKVASQLRELQHNIEESGRLLSELRAELANLAEGHGNNYDAAEAHRQ